MAAAAAEAASLGKIGTKQSKSHSGVVRSFVHIITHTHIVTQHLNELSSQLAAGGGGKCHNI